MTVTPIEMFILVSLFLGCVTMAFGLANKMRNLYFVAMIFFAVGVFLTGVRGNLQCKEAHAAEFAKLPVQWQSFCHRLNDFGNDISKGSKNAVMHTAVAKFVKSGPPSLTLDHYNALVGSKLWHNSQTRVNRALATQCVRDLIILDFATAELE